MQVSPLLNFNGQCAEALRFYEQALGCKTVFMLTYGETPMASQVGPEFQDKVTHSTLDFGDQRVHGADVPPNQYQKPQGISLSLGIKDPAEADRVFAALADGGEVQMPIQQTFWAQRFGMVTDRFGIPWMINCEKPA